MDVDLACEDAIRRPAAYFAAARQHGEVQWSNVHHAWVILSHAGVEDAFRNADTLSADRTRIFQRAAEGKSEAFKHAADLLAGWMNFRDPPAHSRLREPVRAAFTPRVIAELEPKIRDIVSSTLDRFPGDQADLHEHFARPIPALVIAAVLGVDPADGHRLQEWSDDIGQLVFSLSPGAAPDAPVGHAAEEFIAFFSRLIEREKANPSGTILSLIAHSEISRLSQLELVGACTLLLFGGHETTTTLLGNALAILLERPDLMEWLIDHPEADPTAVEEFMRVAGPARAMPRKVAVAHERGGQQLLPGQTAYLAIVAANHDPDVFANPGEIDLARDPNPQLGFGWGLHYCLGSSLGRLEARIALRLLLERYPRMRSLGPIPPVAASVMGFGRRPLPVALA